MQRCQSWLPYIKTLAYSVCEEISYKLYHCSTTPPWTKDGVNQYLKSLDYLVCHSEIMIFYEIYVIFNNSIVMKRLFCLSTAIFLCILMFSTCVI